MKNCEVIKDLLSLYVEDLVSDESRSFIEVHLQSCQECNLIYEKVKNDYEKTNNSETNEKDVERLVSQFAKYQNVLKLSFAFLLTLMAVVFSKIPIPFISTFSLLVLVPIISFFVYKRIWPLLLVNITSVIIGIGVPSETISEAIFFGLLNVVILTISTIIGYLFWKSKHDWKGSSRRKKAITLGFPVVLLAAALFINSGFTGNPVSYVHAYLDVKQYISEHYKDEDLKIEGVYFSWYDSHYFGKVSNGSEEFTIDVYSTGHINDNRLYTYANNYGDSYAQLLQLALDQTAREKNYSQQYFWVTNTSHTNQITSLNEASFIIRFSESNNRYPTMSTLTKTEFLELCQFTIDTLGTLNLPYKDIQFQAKDVNGKEMYLDLEKGITEESIDQY